MYFLWNFFLERRAFTILVMVSLLIAGTMAIVAMPKESTPEVVIPIGIVTTVLPGATAADIERLVTDKLEPGVSNVPNIDKVTSSSRQGVSIITAQFLASADIETAIQDLRNAVELSRRDLPSDAEPPTVTKIDFQEQPVLMIGISSDLAPETLTKLGEDIKDDLLALDGVSKVDVAGVRPREVSVIVNQSALMAHNISVNSVIAALGSANASAPAGTLVMDGIEYPVQFNGEIKTVAEIAALPIATPTGEIRVSDVADVIDGFAETSSVSRLSEGGSESAYAMTINVYKASGGNILSVSQNVLDRLEELDGTLLLGSEYVVVYDAGDEVKRSISELLHAGRDTVLLVILVLFITVGFREAIVSALSIPFSFMIAFLGMWATGNSINFLSLFALVIAIGILVDSGIVVVEAIHTNREKGMEKVAAARQAIRQFGWPLIAGTMTTVAVFLPLFFLTGIIGQFLRSIPFTIIVVLIASIIVSLGFVPLIAMWLLKHNESRFALMRERLWVNLLAWYQAKLDTLFSSRPLQKAFYGILALTFVVAILLPTTGLLKAVMFPPADMDFFYVEVELPQASTLAQTDEVAREVEKVVHQEPTVSSYLTTVGAGSVFNAEGGGSGSKIANITVNLDKDRDGGQSSIDIAASLRQKLIPLQGMNGAKIVVSETAGGPPSGAPIVVKIWSNDTSSLAAATEDVERLIEGIEGTRDIASSLSNDATEIVIGVDRERAADYGLSASDVAFTLQTAIAGVEATKIRIDGEDLSVRVITGLNEEYVQPADASIADIDAISRVPVLTSRGTIPLGSLITVTAGRSSAAIGHEDGMRIGTVNAQVVAGANPVEITGQIQEAAEAMELPDGVRLTYGGEDEEIARTFTEMLIALVAGLVLMFAVLVLEFNAFRTTLRLLLAIPLSLTGVLIGLFLMGQPLSLTAFLGIIALGGVIINHGILLLDVLNHLKAEGGDPRQIVLEAAGSRLRPILLTTITTIAGMIPLISISEMWAPLAYTIAFGLIYGTLLTLVLIPLLSYRQLVKESTR
jgi:multidrug efflux pump subunit AcrB